MPAVFDECWCKNSWERGQGGKQATVGGEPQLVLSARHNRLGVFVHARTGPLIMPGALSWSIGGKPGVGLTFQQGVATTVPFLLTIATVFTRAVFGPAVDGEVWFSCDLGIVSGSIVAVEIYEVCSQ